MEFLVNDESYANEEAMKEFTTYANDQENLASFGFSPDVADFLRMALTYAQDDFPRLLWNEPRRLNATGVSRTLIGIICYTLTDFNPNCKQELKNSNNHERTAFVKYVIPMLKYFTQETDLVEFCWCEKGLETTGTVAMENNDFVVSLSNRRYADALGKNTITKNEEFVESSSGFEKENVNHSLDDTLKLLAECSSSLLHVIKQNKTASIDTMVEKCTLGVQVIKKTLTLTKVTLSKSGRWKLVELRSSCAPTSWATRSNWFRLFELLATIFKELLHQRKIDEVMMEEVNKLKKLESKSVQEHFAKRATL